MVTGKYRFGKATRTKPSSHATKKSTAVNVPFSLMNAPETFHRKLDILLNGYQFKYLFIYLNDVLIFSKEKDSHIKLVYRVFLELKRAGVSLKVNRCLFFND